VDELGLPRFDDHLFPGRTRSNRTFNVWAKSKREFDQTPQLLVMEYPRTKGDAPALAIAR
jgi:hypothetical protein